MKQLLLIFALLTTHHAFAQINGSPVITGSILGSTGGGSTCPTYDSIGVLREDSATFVIFCCAGGCDTLPLIATPGGGPLALWRLNGSSIVQVDTGYNVGTGTTSPLGKFHAQGDNSRIIVSPAGDGALMQYTDGGDTSFIVGVSPGDVYLRANVDGTDYDVILNVSDPDGVKIQGKDTSTGNALTIYSGATSPYAGDTIIEFQNDGDVVVKKFAVGSSEKFATFLGDGTMDTAVGLSGFVIDADENMYAGTGAMSGLTIGTQNMAIGIGAGASVTDGLANMAIGYGADNGASTLSALAIGYSAVGSGEASIAIGANANATGINSVGIGTGAGAAFDSTVCIGNVGVSAKYRTAIAGRDFYFGYSDNLNNPPSTVTINGTGGSGTDINGSNLTIAGGRPTGSGTTGVITFQVAPTGASGTTLRTLVDVGKFDASTTAGDTRFFLYDVDNGTLERVTVGAADSGGSGFKVLRIPN